MKEWKVILIWLLSVILAYIAVFSGYHFWNAWNAWKVRPIPFEKEYSGFCWTRDDPNGDDSKPISIHLKGNISNGDSFRGSIVVRVENEERFRYEDCIVYAYSDDMHLITRPDIEYPTQAAVEHYGEIVFSEDWSEIMLTHVKDYLGEWSSGDRVVYVAPAKTKAEANEVAGRLKEGWLPQNDN